MKRVKAFEPYRKQINRPVCPNKHHHYYSITLTRTKLTPSFHIFLLCAKCKVDEEGGKKAGSDPCKQGVNRSCALFGQINNIVKEVVMLSKGVTAVQKVGRGKKWLKSEDTVEVEKGRI